MTARVLSLGPRELAFNMAATDCELCQGTGLVFGARCPCTSPPARVRYATLAEATEAAAGDNWRVPGWDGQAWVLGQMREHATTCPRCGHKHFGWTYICNDCNGAAFGGGS